MKILVSAMALAVALAWPAVGEAQSKKSKARNAQATQQTHAPARGAARAQRIPCERQVWWGCVGWDPDRNVRDMLARDIGGDD